MEAEKASTEAAVFSLKRPPHIFLSLVIGFEKY
jgi:hypothetical protein